jgi:hypothetical protein
LKSKGLLLSVIVEPGAHLAFIAAVTASSCISATSSGEHIEVR